MNNADLNRELVDVYGIATGVKRQKISVACDPCRARKVRCDGNRPACRQCTRGRKHYTCTYERRLVETQQRHTQELQGLDTQLSNVEHLQSIRESADTGVVADRLTGVSSTPAATGGPSHPTLASDEPQDGVSGESSSTTFLNQLSRHQERP